MTVNDVIEKARQQATKGIALDEKLNKTLICCGCLGDRSDDVNEIVECDGCGVTVHEGVYLEYFRTQFQKKVLLQKNRGLNFKDRISQNFETFGGKIDG